MHVTLNQLKEWEACTDGYRKVISHVGLDYDKDKPINLSTILTSNDVDDTLWCVDRIALTPEQERGFRLLACGYAERVLPIFEKDHPGDMRPRDCIEVARRYAVDEATEEEMAAAKDAAWAAKAAAWAARAAAWDAARAAEKSEQEKMLMEILLKWEEE